MNQHGIPRSLLVLGLAAAACGPTEPVSVEHGVLVVVVDALRYDHLSDAGYHRDTTPALSRFSRECVNFHDAWSASSTIVPSHATLLTGCDPLLSQRPPRVVSHGVEPYWIPAGVPSLAAELVSGGWSTAAFADHPFIGAMRGFDRGFQQFLDWNEGAARPDSELTGTPGKFERWISERDADEKWFAYLHVHDLERLWTDRAEDPRTFEARPELDFVPPCGRDEPIFHAVPPSRWHPERTLGDYEARYDAGLRALDGDLARVFEVLRREGRWEHTTVVIAGSYGIGFGESGLIVASGTLSDVDLHVPLMIRPAPELDIEVGRRIDTVVGLVDVAPTVLSLAGTLPPDGMHGESLLPLMQGRVAPHKDYVFATSGIYDGFAVVSDTYVYEYARPAARKTILATSWSGVTSPDKSTTIEFLKDRGVDTAPGHLGRGVRSPAVAASMHAAGVAWYRGLRKPQRAVHLRELDPTRVDSDDMAILSAHGLLGPEE